MPKTAKTPLAPGLYATPCSKAYWHDAAKELTKPKMLAIAAILIALRVALKPLNITLTPTLSINFGYFVNALGASVFGPVVAIVAAAISDTLGCILFPSGTYFFPFIFTEIAGSLIFALFLYRAPRTNLRVTLARFCVSFFVNIVLQTPIMMLYYDMILGKSYAVFDLPRICKNLVMFPLESLLLILFLNVMEPITYRMHLTYNPPHKQKITGRLIAFLVTLFLVGACATAGYAWYDYNTSNHASSFEAEERAAFNQSLTEQLDLEEGQLALVNKITRTAFHSEETVTFSVYDVAEGTDITALWGLKNSAAKGEKYEGILTVCASGTAVMEKSSGTLLTFALTPIEEQ